MSKRIDERIGRNLFDLSGRAAIVTGAASGLGEAIAGGLAVFGANVALTDVNPQGLEKVAEAVRGAGRQALSVVCDVRERKEVQALADQTVGTFGRVDILVNAAGIARRAPAEQLTDTEWDDVLAVDLTGAFLCAQVAGRAMIEQGQGGRIINIASIGAHVGVTTGNANYAAAKGGLVAMSKCLALEWAQHNILVNCISPTHFDTPLIERGVQDPKTKAYYLSNIPLGRLGEPPEIVGPVVFLASDASSMVTGATIAVDGGHMAK